MPLFIETLTLSNFLSFGPATTIELGPINVIVGTNGSGKTNTIEAFHLLQHAPGDMAAALRAGGGLQEWFWKDPDLPPVQESPVAQLKILISEQSKLSQSHPNKKVTYSIDFSNENQKLAIVDERLENEHPDAGHTQPFMYFGYNKGIPYISRQSERRELRKEDLDHRSSILAQRKDPELYPELTQLGQMFGQIQIYRHWFHGPMSPLRKACPADVTTNTLSPTFDNLPARLSVLMKNPSVKKTCFNGSKTSLQDLMTFISDPKAAPSNSI